MNSLIKPDSHGPNDALQWRPLTSALTANPEPADPVVLALQSEVDALRQALTDFHKHHDQELARVRREVKAEAEAQWVREEAESLAALRAAAQDARSSLDVKLVDIERLALLLCRTALTPIFGADEDRSALVSQAVHAQCDALKREVIVRVVVSARDFPNAAALDALACSVGGIEVVADPVAATGTLHMDLRLGSLDVSLPGYWAELSARIDTLAGEAL